MGFRTIVSIITLALGICAVPLGADAQRSESCPRRYAEHGPASLRVLCPGVRAPPAGAQVRGGPKPRLRVPHRRGASGAAPDLAVALVQLNLDVLVVTGSEAALRAAQQATNSLPIVMVAIDFDPIARGYIAGLARPGGNITGLFFKQVELTGKRLEFLKHAVPALRRVAVFWDGFSANQLPVAEAAARGVGAISPH